MRLKWSGIALVTAAGLIMGGVAGAAASEPGAAALGQSPAAAAAARPQAGNAAAVARGKYIVTAGGCNDCHTPWKMGANGPEPDMSLFLSGHPSSMTLPPPPAPSGPWIMSATATNTAWAGPWGTSFTANLTPDPETGLGQWTEQQFIDTLRTGRRQGRGREILPPMPWTAYKNFTDADLKAIFAYLKTIPPIKNKVPDPILAAPAR